MAACGGDDGDGAPDAALQPTTDHCAYTAQPASANSSGTVEPGAIMAGAAELPLDLPVGSALGAYTARAGFLGNAGKVDIRRWEYSGKFNPSVGVETTPKVRALALSAGAEKLLIVKIDVGVAYDGLVWDLTERLGADYRGKVIAAVSHSHSGPGHFSGNSAMGVGFSRFRRRSYERLLERAEQAAKAAIAAQVPARLGVFVDTKFDPGDQISRDRRNENNELMGGPRKDDYLALLRLDTAQGEPIAIVPLFGVHGTVLDADNPLMSTDAPGAIERGLEEQFDRRVVVMHLQGSGGDVSPAGSGGLDCGGLEYCYDYAGAESTGRAAAPVLLAAWQKAGLAMKDSVPLEVLTRSIELGPKPATFTVRDGALRYAAWNNTSACDRKVWDDQGRVISPIDEFNAPFGAALCGTINQNAIFPEGQMLNTDCVDSFDECADDDMRPYFSCTQLDTAARYLSQILDLDFEKTPVCGSTRTIVSAFRLDELMFVTLPGEPTVMLADRIRAHSPMAADKTVILGYANGEIGYLLTVEDWLQAGYEPSINFWGPLEGEYIAEQAVALAKLAATPTRDDGSVGAAPRSVAPPTSDDGDVPALDPAPMAGTVPASVPTEVYLRGRPALASAQPAATVPRLASARLVWIGEDPLAGTPEVTLQRETAPGSGQFQDVVRRSGRVVSDGDLLRSWTPQPLRRTAGEHATHYWAVEWQAVTWSGIVDVKASDALADRIGAPLGKYRFHVKGTGYTLDSQPFTVVAAALAVVAGKSGTAVTVSVSVDGKGGWRLLDQTARSNKLVPLRAQTVRVILKNAGGTIIKEGDVTVDMNGAGSLDAGAEIGNVKTVEVKDRFDNAGSATL
jgi:hypothetical protein